MKDWNLPAPRFSRFRVEYQTGRGYAVIDPDGIEVLKPTNPHIAAARCDALQAAHDSRHKIGPRACLCCGETFVSEGIHHRMCTRCRGASDPLAIYGMPGVQDGRKSSGTRWR